LDLRARRSPEQVIILKDIRKVTLCELPCNLSAFAEERKSPAFLEPSRIASRECEFLSQRHCEERQRRSNPASISAARKMDCFASLAMTM